MRELFVYYRVRAGAAQALQAAVVAMQRTLAANNSGLQPRLLRRVGPASAAETWMEIYAARDGSAGGIDDAIEANIARHALALAPFIDGPRHVERFESIDPT